MCLWRQPYGWNVCTAVYFRVFYSRGSSFTFRYNVTWHVFANYACIVIKDVFVCVSRVYLCTLVLYIRHTKVHFHRGYLCLLFVISFSHLPFRVFSAAVCLSVCLARLGAVRVLSRQRLAGSVVENAGGSWGTVLYMSYATVQKHLAFKEMLWVFFLEYSSTAVGLFAIGQCAAAWSFFSVDHA